MYKCKHKQGADKVFFFAPNKDGATTSGAPPLLKLRPLTHLAVTQSEQSKMRIKPTFESTGRFLLNEIRLTSSIIL